MLKMYHSNPHAGSTPDYWANSWDDIDFEQALRQCLTDPLRKIFERYVETDALVLEGGCGKGHWVAFFSDRDYKIVGLDFAQRTLAELGSYREGLYLVGGNVNSLPFADETFDVYYSGGVVEHFEAGCGEALAEARRVIKPDGTLLLSVPYYSPMRKVLRPFRSDAWRVVRRAAVDKELYFEGLTYFQYAYTIQEFKAIAKAAGLKTIETIGYSVMWGLYDLKWLHRRAQKKNYRVVNEVTPRCDGSGIEEAGFASLLKGLLIHENTETTFRRAVTGAARWAAANMMMFVLRRDT